MCTYYRKFNKTLVSNSIKLYLLQKEKSVEMCLCILPCMINHGKSAYIVMYCYILMYRFIRS